MDSNGLIELTIRHIDNSFRELQRSLSTYERNENTIEANLERLQRIMRDPVINPLESSIFDLIFTLSDANYRIKRINDSILREIDNIVSLIAGYLTVLIDECIRDYKVRVKVQTRTRLQRLAEMRELTVGDAKRYLTFPTAVAILSPYLIKTRFNDSSANLVSIRQAINSLAEPSY